MNSNIFEQLRAAMTNAGAQAVACSDGSSCTYAELFSLSGRMANVLTARGVKQGARVLVKTSASFHAIALYFAVLRTGAVYVPIHAACTGREFEHVVEDTRPMLIVCDPKETAALASAVNAAIEDLDARGRGSLMAAAARMPEKFASAHRAPDDIAAILYPAGINESPNARTLTHADLALRAMALNDNDNDPSAGRLFPAIPVLAAQCPVAAVAM